MKEFHEVLFVLSFKMRESLVVLWLSWNFTQGSLSWVFRWGSRLWCCSFLSGCHFLCVLQSGSRRVVFWHGSFSWCSNVCCCMSLMKLVCKSWLIRSSCCFAFPWLTEESVLSSWDIVLPTISADESSIVGMSVLPWHTSPVQSTLITVLLSRKLI